jgi:hypothetical protein
LCSRFSCGQREQPLGLDRNRHLPGGGVWPGDMGLLQHDDFVGEGTDGTGQRIWESHNLAAVLQTALIEGVGCPAGTYRSRNIRQYWGTLVKCYLT